MKKRQIYLLLAIVMMFTLTLVACGKKEEPTAEAPVETPEANEPTTEEPEAEPTEKLAYKIGIMTGTVSQGEEEYRAAENLVAKYGADTVLQTTYPDKFAQEQETTVSNLKVLASDPDIKAIIVTQSVNGVSSAFEEIKQTRPDILLIAGAPGEDPSMISKAADMTLDTNQLMRGTSILATAKEMGAETFVHYSFPRHLSMELLAARRDDMREAAEEMGIKFVEVDAPDPSSDAGAAGTQQFIIEDIPRQVAEFGPNTAFFGTNCSMQEAMIGAIINEGAIYPEQCCPSPYHAYPGALGIKIPEDKAGDIDYLNEQIKAKLEEKGATGRFGTWVRPANVSIINAAFEYAKDYAEGRAEKVDFDLFAEKMSEYTELPVEALHFTEYKDLEGYRLFILDSLIY